MSISRDQELEELARARTPVLLRSAWLLCGDRHQSEDLVQETLAKVYLKWGLRVGRGIENPAAHAQTTLTRTFLSARRRRSSTEQPWAEVPDRVQIDATTSRTTRLALVDALSGLAPQDRVVLVLRHLEDLSVEETAAVMGVSAGAVRSRSSRATDRLRPLLQSTLHHEDLP